MSRAVFTSDENKLHLTAGDLFDRIINLKLVCENKVTKEMETFVIRSDYELVYTNVDLDNFIGQADNTNKKYMIRRCTFKPSIKVQCKMVTSNVATSVDIFINNFFMLTKNGDYIRSFNESQYYIKSVTIAMGYWGQFENTVDPYSEDALEQYFDIKAENGADSLTLTSPIVVTTDKLPPDSTLHLHGYVADIYGSPVGITNIDDAQKAFGKPSISSGTDMEAVFGECSCLEKLPDLSKWDIINSTNIKNIFFKCESLNFLPDISNWKIDNIKDLSFIFSGCKSLKNCLIYQIGK